MAEYKVAGEIDDTRHYGLNFEAYTHFTSPIRRYADILVHRLVTIALKEGEATRDKLHGIDYGEYVDRITTRNFNSRQASQDCDTLFHCYLLKDQGPKILPALVFDIDPFNLHLYLPSLHINTQYRLRDDPRIDQTTYLDSTL